MPIIYSYPSKISPSSGDLLIISDVTASNQTKKITIGDLKDPLDVVDSLTATLPIKVSASTGDVTISSRAYGGTNITGHVPLGGTNSTFLRGDGTWQVPSGGGSGSPAGSNTQIQFNNSGAFGATDLFTYTNRILSVGKVGDTARSHLKVYGGGSDDAYLTLYCSAGTHGVTIEGPDHTGGSNYTLKLPKVITTQTAYSSGGRILESNSSGALQWINTPTGSGDTYTLQAEAKSGSSVPLKLNATTGTDSTVNLKEGTNITLTQNGATEIEIAASGGASPAGSNQEVQFNNSTNFGASGNFRFISSTRILQIGDQDTASGTVIISGGLTGGAGQLRIGDDGTSGNEITIKAASNVTGPYNIVLPGSGPGTANRILESDASGNLSWINTPGASYTLPLAANGTRGGIQIGYAQNAKNYPVVLDSEKAYVNVPWTDNNTTYTGSSGILLTGTDFTNTDKGSSQYIYKNFAATAGGTATANSNNDTLTIAAGTGITTTRSGDTITIGTTIESQAQGFEPLSIYEATGYIKSVAEVSSLTVMRQSVCEAVGEISKVDFFRLSGTNKVTIGVYVGSIAGGATLVLSGQQTTGTANSINTITFSSPHAFTAGDNIVIVISLYQTAGGGGAEVIGSSNLLSNTVLSRQANVFINTYDNDLNELIGNYSIEDPSTKGASLHFYNG